MNLVEDIAHFGGKLIELALHIGQDVVAKVDQTLQLAAPKFVGNVVSGYYGVDKNAREIAFVLGGGRRNGRCGGMGDFRRNGIDQRAPARGKDDDVVVATEEETDVH